MNDEAEARERAWYALHDPATDAGALAAIAERHPEFAGAIAQHPNCYPDLRVWAESQDAASALSGVATDPVHPDPVHPDPAHPVPAHSAPARRDRVKPASSHRAGWIIAAGAAATILLGGGAVWAAVALIPASPTPSGGTEVMAGEGGRVLAGEPVYIGDELDWFLLDENTLSGYFPDAGDMTTTPSFAMVGESEGVHTSPDACMSWVIPDDWMVVNARRTTWPVAGGESWAGGAYGVYQFPTGELAANYYDRLAGTAAECALFDTLGPDESVYGTTQLQVVAGSAGDGAVVVDARGTDSLGRTQMTTRAYALEGNVVVAIAADRTQETIVDAEGLVTDLRERIAQARTALTEKIGYR